MNIFVDNPFFSPTTSITSFGLHFSADSLILLFYPVNNSVICLVVFFLNFAKLVVFNLSRVQAEMLSGNIFPSVTV